MFGAETAAQGLHLILDRLDHGIRQGGVIARGVDREVDVAIAQMRDVQRLGTRVQAWQAGVDAVQHFGHLVEGQADVGVDGGLARHRNFGGQFAALPHGAALRFGLRNLGVKDRAGFHECGKSVLQQGGQRHIACGIWGGVARRSGGDFDKDIGVIAFAAKGQRYIGPGLGQAAHIAGGHQFERLHQTSCCLAQLVQKHQGIGQAAHGQGGGGIGAGARDEFHDRGGDDAQSPFSPDEHLLQVIA